VVSSSTGPAGLFQQPPKQRSRWLWWVYLGCGMGSCIGFIIVAVKVQNRKFVRAAVVSVVSCIVGFVSYEIWPPVEEASQTTRSGSSTDVATFTNSMWIITAIWIGLIVYGHILDRDYKKFLRAQDDENNLRWHATRAQARALYEPGAGGFATAPRYVVPAPAPTPPPRPAVPSVDRLIAQADEFLTTQPPGNLPGPMPPNVPVT
jgi:hypothetical protein